jgi:hypothetical protein
MDDEDRKGILQLPSSCVTKVEGNLCGNFTKGHKMQLEGF